MGIQISQQVRAARPGPATESVAETEAGRAVPAAPAARGGRTIMHRLVHTSLVLEIISLRQNT